MKALWDIVRSAIPTMPFPPSEYAGYANAIVGKPLALVNAGWSIELAEAPYWKQHTLPPPEIPGTKNGVKDTIDPLRPKAQALLESYSFKVKIGDAERPFDGVVAFWDADNANTTAKDDPKSSTKTDFNKLWAYTESDVTKGISKLIEPATFPTMSPYFLHPETATDAESFTRQHTSKLMTKTLLIDPYTPIHLYSGILPIKGLQLAGWTIQNALKNMSQSCPGILLPPSHFPTPTSLYKSLLTSPSRVLHSRPPPPPHRRPQILRHHPPPRGRFMVPKPRLHHYRRRPH